MVMSDRSVRKRSLYEGVPNSAEESVDVLCLSGSARIERIVSRGQASPEGFWYDQENNEFVLVVKGSAGLMFENEEGVLVLNPGDYININAHVKHRVEWTDAACETIWLAVYY